MEWVILYRRDDGRVAALMDRGEIQLFTDHDEALRVGEHVTLAVVTSRQAGG
jgi:hypothetical protein